ncbi:sugar kinase [Pseudochryseolinea flava]|uniref:sugar kinase n=1 Tax=Pseudochryseolinea flava TaxID=2059302 RepID=UPI0021CE0625|nr:sugar kinase [Pseudochryseolinea flava]
MNTRTLEHSKSNTPQIITLGEIMLRLSTPGYARFTQAQHFEVQYGGSEANVAVALANFGLSAAHVTRFPKHELGVAATQALRKNNVETKHIVYGDERMGIYFVENGAMQRSSKLIYDRFDSAFSHIKKGMIDWDEVFKNASWFHWSGITPAISQGAADVCLEAIEAARKNNVLVSGDINYRRNLWQYGKTVQEIMPALIASTDFVIAGTTDIENCTGITGDSFEEACANFMKQYPAVKKVTTTIRDSISSSHNKISATLWDGKKLINSQAYDLTHIVDRIGAGDAYMAGLIYGWLTKKDDQQTLEFATAATVWKHSVEGDVNIATVAEIEALARGENVGRLLR